MNKVLFSVLGGRLFYGVKVRIKHERSLLVSGEVQPSVLSHD